MALTYLEFKSFEDLVRFVTFSQAPFLEYIELNGHHVYFFQIGMFGERILYYAELNKKADGRYVIYNRFKDAVSFSNKLETDGQSVSIPVLEIARTNAFGEYPPK